MTFVIAGVAAPLPLRPPLPPPPCQPVTCVLPFAQSGFNWKLRDGKGCLRPLPRIRTDPQGMGDSLSSDISRQARILLRDRAGRSGCRSYLRVVGRKGPGSCECVGGKAGRGHTTFSEPSANSPGTIGHAHHGRGPLSTWPSQPRCTQVSAARPCALVRLAGCRQRARAREGQRPEGDPAGGGVAGRALGRPLPPSARPARPPGAPDSRQNPAVLPERSACSAQCFYLWSPGRWGRPLPGHLSHLLLRKPPAQLPASRIGGAGTPGHGARLAAGDM